MEQVYPSDLTEEQWQVIAPLIPPARPGGRPRRVNIQAVLNGIFYILRTGCAWRMLTKDYPPWETVYYRRLNYQK
ncbi:MAG: transposase [Thermoguttaceae bacterium]|nr:transposase [Thermoguttaceae bacterium]MDW8037425.1 transposase [Thermoguttaceae bacterium]